MVKSVSTTVQGSIMGQRRESIYYKHKRINEDGEIQSELIRLAGLHLNWGFGLLYAKVHLQGRLWNKKRVYRNYKVLNLNLRSPEKRKKIKRANPNTIAAETVNEGWSLDFLSDDVIDEKKTRILSVMAAATADEYSRKCLLIDAKKTYKAKALVESLKNLSQTYGTPKYIRCDNGPELISNQLAKFCKNNNIEIRFSQRQRPTVRKTNAAWAC